MSTASIDRLLAVLIVAMAVTGLASLRAGTPSTGWLFVLHGVLAGALAAAVAVKLRRSLPRAVRSGRHGRLALGLVVSLMSIAALTGGFLWVAGGRLLTVGGWTVLTLHAWVGLVLVPLVVVHLLPHRWRLLRPATAHRGERPPMSRRTFLATAGFGLAGVAIAGGANVAERVSGGERRFTGSRWLPSGGLPPVTTFFGEPTPQFELAAWRLRVGGSVDQAASLTLEDLQALGEGDLTAVLDCTSGWAIETAWRGVPLAAVLAAVGVNPAARTVQVRSATGWVADLPIADASFALLATGVAGGPLPLGNGAPVRLVIPDRRGLDWVKWVTDIEVS